MPASHRPQPYTITLNDVEFTCVWDSVNECYATHEAMETDSRWTITVGSVTLRISDAEGQRAGLAPIAGAGCTVNYDECGNFIGCDSCDWKHTEPPPCESGPADGR